MVSAALHGFVKGRLCLTNMVSALQVASRWVDEGKSDNHFYLDISNAFNSVPRRFLLAKLQSYKHTKMALRWIKAFLSRRSFRVCVFATLVSCADVPLGTQPGFHAWTSVFPYMNKWSAGVSWRSMYDACGRCQLSCLRWIVSRICKRTGIAFRNGQWQWNYI